EKVFHRGRTGARDQVGAVLRQLPARAAGVARLGHRPVRERLVQDRSRSREFFGQDIPRLLCANQQNAQIFDASLLFEFPQHRLGDEFIRLKFEMQMEVFYSLGRSRPEGGNTRAPECARVMVYLEKSLDE